MGKKQIILITVIVVFGLGSYLAIIISSGQFEDTYCGEYKEQLQDSYYDECLQTGNAPFVCENESINKAWEEVQIMQEEDCKKNIQ